MESTPDYQENISLTSKFDLVICILWNDWAVQFRSIPMDASPDGDVIHREPTLGQKLLDVAVRKRKAQIPADRQENELRLKLAPPEQAANRRVQKEHPTSLSRQA
jgi:hypothetical protein